MKISSDIIAFNLSGNYSFRQLGKLSGELNLERPLFLRDSKRLMDRQIYLMNIRDHHFSVVAPLESMLLCVGEPSAEMVKCFSATLVFAPNVSLLDLHNAVQEIYSEHEQWEFDLIDIAQRGGGIRAMLDSAERVFQNPMMLHDKDFGVIAISTRLETDSGLRWTMDENYLHELRNEFRVNPAFAKTFQTREPTIFPAGATQVRSMYLNLFYQGQFRFRLLALECKRDFMPSDGPMLEFLSRYVQLAIDSDVANEMGEKLTLPHVFKNILTGGYSDPYYIDQRLSEFGWLASHQFVCFKTVVQMLSMQVSSNAYLCEHIERHLRGACAFEYNKEIVVFVNLDLYGGDTARILSELVVFLRDSDMRAGVSNVFAGFRETVLAYKQADIALRVGQHNRPHFWIHKFKDNIELLLLESCVSQLPAHMVCAPEILMLRRYDAEHNTEYYHTLHLYLKNHFHRVKTAGDLYIHRSTFLYRLDRIRELTGLDIEAREKQWYLLLSYKLLEMASAQ